MAENAVLRDMHMHTPLCKHARGEPEEYARAGFERGLLGITFTCHNPDDAGWSPGVRMDISELDDYVGMVERARIAWEGRIEILLGLECDYVPGMEAWIEKLLGMADFHYVLGSVHLHLPDYRERYSDHDPVTYHRTYFDHQAQAAETGLFDCLAHPDLAKAIDADRWQPQRVADAVEDCLDRVAATGVAMELNTSGMNKVGEVYPSSAMLSAMQRRGIPVNLGSDAHDPHRVGADFEHGLQQLSDAGYSHVGVVTNRQRTEVPIADALGSLSGRFRK